MIVRNVILCRDISNGFILNINSRDKDQFLALHKKNDTHFCNCFCIGLNSVKCYQKERISLHQVAVCFN